MKGTGQLVVGPPPCDVFICPMWEVCKSRQLACAAFYRYYAFGEVHDPCTRFDWKGDPAGQQPSPVASGYIYDLAFGGAKFDKNKVYGDAS